MGGRKLGANTRDRIIAYLKVNANVSSRDAADHLGVRLSMIQEMRQRYKLPHKREPRPCRLCSTHFAPRSDPHIYCSRTCKQRGEAVLLKAREQGGEESRGMKKIPRYEDDPRIPARDSISLRW